MKILSNSKKQKTKKREMSPGHRVLGVQLVSSRLRELLILSASSRLLLAQVYREKNGRWKPMKINKKLNRGGMSPLFDFHLNFPPFLGSLERGTKSPVVCLENTDNGSLSSGPVRLDGAADSKYSIVPDIHTYTVAGVLCFIRSCSARCPFSTGEKMRISGR